MKLPLKVIDDEIQVVSILRAPKYHAFGYVTFSIDTGANRSALSFGDARLLGLPTSRLEHLETAAIVEHKIKLCNIKNLTLSFENEKGGLERFNLNGFSVMVPTKKGSKREEAKKIPSILGVDFLRENKLALFLNAHDNIAYLER